MGEKFGHVWELRVGERVYVPHLRAIARHPPRGTPATVDLVVNHPDPAVVEAARAGGPTVWTVLAGYQRDTGAVVIGSGTVVPGTVDYDRADPSIPLEVQLSASRVSSQVVLGASWPDEVSARELFGFCATQAGLELNLTLAEEVAYPHGYRMAGPFRTVVGDLAADNRLAWRVEGATLYAWPIDDVARETGSLWSPSTGLLGVVGPAGGDPSIRAVSLLDPARRPGDGLRIVDDAYAGDVRITECTHEVDTSSGTFRTSAKVVPRG